MEERKETPEEREAREAWLNGEELNEEKIPENAENSKSKAKVEELRENIAKWQEELDTVWAGKETDAAEVERRNLRNLIANAKREIEEIENPKTQNELGNNFDDLKKKFEEIKKEGQDKEVEKNRLRQHIERLKEERENYASQKNTSYKDIYNEYTKQIEDAEKEIEELEKEEPQAEQDKKIRTVTALRQEYETQIRDKEKEIRAVKRQIEDIEYATEEAMVEKELEDGTKVKTPKVLELYKDLEKLEKELKDLENKKDECQQYLDEIKGKVESRELDPEEIKYFHGQGDVVENTRDDRRANDEYYGFEKVKPGMRKEPRGLDEVIPKPGPEPETNTPIRKNEPNTKTGQQPATPTSNPIHPLLTPKDLFDLHLLGPESKLNREKISLYFHLGYCNGKTFLKRLNLLNLTKKEIEVVLNHD